MKRVRSLVGVLAVFGMIGGYAFATASPAIAATLSVGGLGGFPTIQAAVNFASPGDTIIVQPGIYNESVVITKSVKIHGAPNKPNPVLDGTGLASDSGCGDAFGELDGFCVFPPGPGTIKNVEIDHFTIQNFPEIGIVAVNAAGLNFHDNTLANNGRIGIAAFASSQTQVVNNTITGSQQAGVSIGDSPNASVLIRRNDVSQNRYGLFLQDSAHGTVTENTANGNCFGILLVDTGFPGDTFDWTLVHNTANDNTLACPLIPGDIPDPAVSGVGIGVAGARNSRLTANTTNGNFATGATPATGGIIVVSGAIAGGPPPSFLQIDNNSAAGNAVDLFWDTSGTKIVFTRNNCTTSAIPPNLCSL